MDDLEKVDRVPNPNSPEGNKALGGFLMGLLATEFNAANAQKLMKFLGDRLNGKSIELTVEANGKTLIVKTYSREEPEAAIKVEKDFVAV